MIAERLPLAIVACCILQLPGCFAAAQGYAPWLRPMQALLASQAVESYPTNGLVAYWSMDSVSGSTVSDDWAANNGSISNAPTISATYGKRGDGVRFVAASKHSIDVPDSAALDVSYVSISAWIFPGGVAEFKRICNKAFDSNLGDAWSLQISNASQPQFVVRNATGAIRYGVASAVPTNQWLHVVGTYDGSQARLYCNGSLAGNGVLGATGFGTSPSYTGALQTTAQPLWMGKTKSVTFSFSSQYQDEIAVYNRALTAGEIAIIYNSGAGRFLPLE